jgi:hypothetical protein
MGKLRLHELCLASTATNQGCYQEMTNETCYIIKNVGQEYKKDRAYFDSELALFKTPAKYAHAIEQSQRGP